MEIDYGALFGVEVDQGAEEQEVAEPAENREDADNAGAEGQEVAEPAAADSQEQTVAETAAGNQDGLSQEQQGQSAEENARYAAARRKAEQERDAAIERARADAQAEAKRVIDEAFQGSGLVNPYTKQPIQSKADFDAYKQAFEEDQRAKLRRLKSEAEDVKEERVKELASLQKEEAEASSIISGLRRDKSKYEKELAAKKKEVEALDREIKRIIQAAMKAADSGKSSF